MPGYVWGTHSERRVIITQKAMAYPHILQAYLPC